MRVALVNHRDWLAGGMDKVALAQLTALEERGLTTAMFTQYHPNNRPSPYRHLFPKDAERLNYKLSLSRLHRVPKDIGQTFNNPENGHQFGRFLDGFKPDIVHVHGLLRSFSPALYEAANQRGIPVYQTHHYTKLICPTGKLLRAEKTYCHDMPCLNGSGITCVLERCQQGSLPMSLMSALEFKINRQRYIHLPDYHLAPSQYLMSLLKIAGVPTEKLHRHANFVDTSRFYPASNPVSRGNYFVYVGRLSHEKGITTLLQAFQSLPFELYLIGDGPMTPEIIRWKERNTQTNIHCLGHLSEDEIRPWIQGARATLLPSLWGEIFGLSILESFACGTPVIGSRIGAIPELILHEENGLLVEPGNVPAWEEAIRQLGHSPDKTLCDMGYVGLRAVHESYTLTRHIDSLLFFYKEGVLVGA